MPADFPAVFACLKPVLAEYADRLSVADDSPLGYRLVTKSPSPFPQHKGHPLEFGAVRVGKSYVSLHLMPLYMCPELGEHVSPELKKRMQGKTCFNFKTLPGEPLLADLRRLTDECFKQWKARTWI